MLKLYYVSLIRMLTIFYFHINSFNVCFLQGMASSDDEAEILPEFVSTYYFLNHEDEPISFTVVPCLWSESEKPDRGREIVYLHGSVDNGLKTIYKEIKAWKFDLSNVKPEISVLSKENNWFKLERPRKSYEDTIRSVLITVNSLHYLKRNPDASGKTLWDYLAKVFRYFCDGSGFMCRWTSQSVPLTSLCFLV